MSFNVLIVDDSHSMRSVIKKIISISGFKMDQCYEAGNGKQALEILSKTWVDVILSDLNMPEMNGMELLSALMGDNVLQEIPVIIVSTEGSEERRKLVLEMGAKQFIKKPFSPEHVRKILYEVIGVGEDGTYEGNERGGESGDF
jgi:two-component system chemotaxis response regulator CheY